MIAAPEYNLETQTKIIPALCVLHNVIQVYNPDENLRVEEELTRPTLRRSPEDYHHHFLLQNVQGLAKDVTYSNCKSNAKAVPKVYG
jgi:hypothetical protein